MTQTTKIMIIIVAMLALFWGLGDAPLRGRINEGRRSLISQQFYLGNHSLLVPHSLKGVTLTKPPLFYWVQAISYSIFSDNEFAARLPSAIAGMLVLIIVYLLGKDWGGEQQGWLSAILCLSSYPIMRYARLAEMDMFLLLFIMLAIYAFHRYQHNPGWRQALPFWLFCSLGFMVKGPHAIIFPLAGILPYYIYYRKEKLNIKQLFHWSGILLFLVIVLPWYIYIYKTMPETIAILRQETINRLTSSAAKRHPTWYYLEKIPDLLPWLFAAIPATIYFWRKKEKQAHFWILYIITNFIILSLIKSKKSVYMLPLIPAITILAAAWLQNIVKYGESKLNRKIIRHSFILTITIAIIAPIALLIKYKSTIPATAFCIIAIITATIIAYNQRKQPKLITTIIHTATLIVIITTCWYNTGFIIESKRRSYKQFAIQLYKKIDKNDQYYAYCADNFSLAFYSKNIPKNWDGKQTLQKNDKLLLHRKNLINIEQQKYKIILDISTLMKNKQPKNLGDLVLIQIQ